MLVLLSIFWSKWLLYFLLCGQNLRIKMHVLSIYFILTTVSLVYQ